MVRTQQQQQQQRQPSGRTSECQQDRRRPILIFTPSPARAWLVLLLVHVMGTSTNHPCYSAVAAAAAAAVSIHPDPYVQRHREHARVQRRLQNLYFGDKAGNNGGKRGSIRPSSILSLFGRIGNAMHVKLTGGTMHHQHQQHRQPGTRFTFRFPTQHIANEMYSDIVSPSIPVQFNHDCVGMTKPCRDLVPATTRTTTTTTHESKRSEQQKKRHRDDYARKGVGDYTLDRYGWPVTSNRFRSNGEARNEDEKDEEGRWRVLRYRRCVGYGRRCYDEVKRAVLDWEFGTVDEADMGGRSRVEQSSSLSNSSSSSGSRPRAMGIIRARSAFQPSATATGGVDAPSLRGIRNTSPLAGSSPSDEAQTLSNHNAQEIFLGAAGRRMVTYTEVRCGMGIRWGRFRINIGGLLPTLYAVSPVASVYDVVDERCSNGDIYTSTAYATVGRHLLSGEERATAILRHDSDNLRYGKAQPVHVEILSCSRSAPSFVGKVVWPLVGRMQSKFFEAEIEHFVRIGDNLSC